MSSFYIIWYGLVYIGIVGIVGNIGFIFRLFLICAGLVFVFFLTWFFYFVGVIIYNVVCKVVEVILDWGFSGEKSWKGFFSSLVGCLFFDGRVWGGRWAGFGGSVVAGVWGCFES